MEKENLNIEPLPLEKQPEKPMEENLPQELKETPTFEQNKKGIASTINAIDFLVALGSAVATSLEDGSFSVLDALNFYDPAKKLFPFVSGISDIPSELGDVITEEEQVEIVERIKKSGFLQGRSEEVAIEALDLVLHMKRFIFKNFINKN